ncbi:MAG: DUF5050 domain-containing protein [Oscillospiraceae bacterium]|nr:DUF5050 domain-containing protein [Oscillospiraceae bacterium]
MELQKLHQTHLIEIINNLPLDERVAVYFYYIEKLDVSQIAEQLAITPDEVGERLTSARAKIKEDTEKENNPIGAIFITGGLIAFIPILKNAMKTSDFPAEVMNIITRLNALSAPATAVTTATVPIKAIAAVIAGVVVTGGLVAGVLVADPFEWRNTTPTYADSDLDETRRTTTATIENEPAAPEDSTPPEDPTEPIPEVNISADIYNAYVDILLNEISQDKTVYADLIDFNNDGVYELVVTTLPPNGIFRTWQVYDTDLTMLYSAEEYGGMDYVKVIEIIGSQGGTKYLNEQNTFVIMDATGWHNEHLYYTLVDDEWTLELATLRERFYDSDDIFVFIDDVEVTLPEYENHALANIPNYHENGLPDVYATIDRLVELGATPPQFPPPPAHGIPILNTGTVYGDWVYYRWSDNHDGSGEIYRTRIDGSERTVLYNDYSEYSYILGDWIFFNGYALGMVRIDGTEYTSFDSGITDEFKVVGDWIYYRNDSQNRYLYRININNGEKHVLAHDWCLYIHVEDGWVYYVRVISGNPVIHNIYRVRTNGTERTQLNDEQSQIIDVVDGWIYYTVYGDSETYKMRVDGTGRTIAD